MDPRFEREKVALLLGFVLLAVSYGGGGDGGNSRGNRPIALPPPEPIALLDTIPAQRTTVDPATSGVNIVHAATPGWQFTYSGGCGSAGVAVRRSLTDLSMGNENHLIDHELACELADVSAYGVTVDASADDGRRYRGALEFSTRQGGGETLTVLDHLVTPQSEVGELFVRYIEDSLLDDIEPHLLAVVVARIVGEIAERSWKELSGRATYGVIAHSVSYPSRNPAGEPSLLTGLIAMPDVNSVSASAESFERKDRVVILHHATGSTPGSLSATGSGQLLANLIASRGYLVIAPDNWGRGGSAGDASSGTDRPETYLMANRVANNALDMMAAVMASDDYRMFHDPAQDTEVSIVGYSQGGHSAVGVWLANQVGGTCIRVRELYSGGAPHDLYRTFRGSLQLLNGSCDGSPWCPTVDTETILGYLTDRILPPLLAYADIGLERNEVFEGDNLAGDFITGMLDGDARYDTLKTMLQLNSFTNIIDPAETIASRDSRIHLYHSPFDRLVPQRNRPLDEFFSEQAVDGFRESSLAKGLPLVVLQKSADLVHAFMQRGDNADGPIRQRLPVHEMPLVAENVAIHFELRRDRPRGDRPGRDALERFEQSADVRIRLGFSPALARVTVNFVDADSRRILDAHRRHAPGCVLFFSITSAADSAW